MSVRVNRSKRFNQELLVITKFIAISNPKNARSFYEDVKTFVETLIDNPRKGRPTEDGNRELIHKGYTIPYLIDGEDIVILGIFNQNEWSREGD
ncbi:MAG: type II toxin-antitoxin system RelE/ParE family toxin [Sulfuricurvum sp.]|uniref:type II toxin-antitoxin system RelE/ParE family toxin n=1 Tax=Sulfuricurvum sp. TaxID=2025608 RepID=UPI002734D563|nr:type II toxin-antitoxin system RelE/ParE family toxin [Sulfuricurvum sp.]MDP2850305.1 type II toxin-antitoxin system RelE/ParE family toxin [Sulfuricurvum sp.]